MGVGEHSDAFLLSEFVTIACLESMIRLDRKGISPKTKPDGPMEAVRLCGARSESLRRTFLVRVSKTAAYTRSLSGPVRAGASKKLGAFRFKLRLKPPSLVDGEFHRGKAPGALPFSGAKGRSEVTCVPHSHASASR